MTKFYTYCVLLIFSLIGLIFYHFGLKNGGYKDEILIFISIGLSASIGALIEFLSEHWKTFFSDIRCLLSKRNQDVYVSLSYLYRIKIDGYNKYLMVRGNKIKNQYQPVGGVYKKYPSLEEKWHTWGATGAKNTLENSDDLRFVVKRKFIPEIRTWFNERKNREIDVWREFCEELIETEILPKNLFTHIKPEFLYSKEEPLIYRKGKNLEQFLIYDIYGVHFSSEQEKAIIDLYKSSEMTNDYAFVDEDELDKELFLNKEEEHQLGYHARYLKSKETC